MNLTEQHALALADNIPSRLLTGMEVLEWATGDWMHVFGGWKHDSGRLQICATPSDLDGLVGACVREMGARGAWVVPADDDDCNSWYIDSTPECRIRTGRGDNYTSLAHAVAEAVEAMAAERSKA